MLSLWYGRSYVSFLGAVFLNQYHVCNIFILHKQRKTFILNILFINTFLVNKGNIQPILKTIMPCLKMFLDKNDQKTKNMSFSF